MPPAMQAHCFINLYYQKNQNIILIKKNISNFILNVFNFTEN